MTCEQMYSEEKNAVMWDCCFLSSVLDCELCHSSVTLYFFDSPNFLENMRLIKVKDEGSFNFKLNFN